MLTISYGDQKVKEIPLSTDLAENCRWAPEIVALINPNDSNDVRLSGMLTMVEVDPSRKGLNVALNQNGLVKGSV